MAKHTVRIVGGMWKRTILPVIDVPGLRPSGDRVRETLFNWINYFLGDRLAQCEALDLFAGTGALGFESASRGFKQVTLVELNRKAYENLVSVKEKLQAHQVQLVCDNAVHFVQHAIATEKKYDCIFLDPPFKSDYLNKIMPLCSLLLKVGGLIYIESDKLLTQEDVVFLNGNKYEYNLIRKMQTGRVFCHLLHKSE